MNFLNKIFPLSRASEGKKVFISLLIYLAVNLAVGVLDTLLTGLGFEQIGGIVALIVNVYVYIGIFVLAYNFIKDVKR